MILGKICTNKLTFPQKEQEYVLCCVTSIFFTILRSEAPYRVPYLPVIPTFLVRLAYMIQNHRLKYCHKNDLFTCLKTLTTWFFSLAKQQGCRNITSIHRNKLLSTNYHDVLNFLGVQISEKSADLIEECFLVLKLIWNINNERNLPFFWLKYAVSYRHVVRKKPHRSAQTEVIERRYQLCLSFLVKSALKYR